MLAICRVDLSGLSFPDYLSKQGNKKKKKKKRMRSNKKNEKILGNFAAAQPRRALVCLPPRRHAARASAHVPCIDLCSIMLVVVTVDFLSCQERPSD